MPGSFVWYIKSMENVAATVLIVLMIACGIFGVLYRNHIIYKR
jgi:hypothetical protein